ncbi:MAG: hypothetical protein MJ175_08925 [Clostridia bacterium]|nr:hypothetical protein [Clostridia bacterium]
MVHQVLFLGAYLMMFLLTGLIHVFLYGVPFTDSIMLLIYGGIAFIWGVTITQRIVDQRVRRLLLAVVVQLELFFLLQICNYKLFTASVTLKRYCWYAYYLPMIFVPLLLLYIALYLGRPKEKKLSPPWTIPAVIMSLIAVGFLTNDLHFLAFRFLGTEMSPTADRALGPVYYLYVVCAILAVLTAVIIIFRKCRVTVSRRFVWIPAVPLVLGIAWLATNIFRTPLRINGIALWNMGEVLFSMTLGFFESCIRIGLIPANTEYEAIFKELKMPIRITDADGIVRYSSGSRNGITSGEAEVRVGQQEIRGGSVSWAVDITELNELDRQIQETTEQIKARNEYLRTENELKEESTAIAARNRLYDTIAAQVKPQLDEIRFLLNDAEQGDFCAVLKKISVLNVYIKRRSNMMLLCTDSMPEQCPEVSSSELSMAVGESLGWLELMGTVTMLNMAEERTLPIEMITLAYDFFETAIEAVLETVKALTVTVSFPDDGLTIRLMFSGTYPMSVFNDWKKEVLKQYHGHIESDGDETDTVVTLYLRRGGDIQ